VLCHRALQDFPGLSAGVTLTVVSSFYHVRDEANQRKTIAGYKIVGLHTSYQRSPHYEFFAQITDLLNKQYSSRGILSDPAGIGAPGIPPDGVSNGPGVNNRFQSPAAPFEAFAGVRFSF
jgi:outer membrane receptor protein involved in Fe transport